MNDPMTSNMCPVRKRFDRRQFLYFAAGVLTADLFSFAAASEIKTWLNKYDRYPLTVSVLKEAYLIEIMAYNNYISCSRKAIEEGYPNIAYLFTSFSVSEKIHADNYKNLLGSLDARIEAPGKAIDISDTRLNLMTAAEKELLKIKRTYPDFLARLARESHDQAVVHCMYSWRSHRQHEKKISKINRYTGVFFRSVAKRIEEMKYNFHVCGVCGSTIDEPPKVACEICNFPISHYCRIKKPA